MKRVVRVVFRLDEMASSCMMSWGNSDDFETTVSLAERIRVTTTGRTNTVGKINLHVLRRYSVNR